MLNKRNHSGCSVSMEQGSHTGFAKTREKTAELRLMMVESRAVKIGVGNIQWTQEFVSR